MGNIGINIFVVFVNISLAVAHELVHHFKHVEEGGDEHEEQVGCNSWSALLIDTMSDKLGEPAKDI